MGPLICPDPEISSMGWVQSIKNLKNVNRTCATQFSLGSDGFDPRMVFSLAQADGSLSGVMSKPVFQKSHESRRITMITTESVF